MEVEEAEDVRTEEEEERGKAFVEVDAGELDSQ